jgi:DNA invertase Pin-like site-specific DNA recombinase
MEDNMVGIYCRVSTNFQSTGLESQLRSLEEYCKAVKYSNTKPIRTKAFQEQKKADQLLIF